MKVRARIEVPGGVTWISDDAAPLEHGVCVRGKLGSQALYVDGQRVGVAYVVMPMQVDMYYGDESLPLQALIQTTEIDCALDL